MIGLYKVIILQRKIKKHQNGFDYGTEYRY